MVSANTNPNPNTAGEASMQAYWESIMGSVTARDGGESSSSSSSSSGAAMTMIMIDLATAVAMGMAGLGIGWIAGFAWGRRSNNKQSKSLLASRPPYTPGQTPPPPPPSSLLPSSFGKKVHTFDPSKLSSAYNLMISTITPRPIALVATTHPTTGIDNLAPFSYFGCVGHDPPMIAIGFCRHRNGQLKDSIANILTAQEFTVQIVSEWYLDAANHSCGAFPPETDEFVESGLSKIQPFSSENDDVVAAPRVAQAGVVYECQLVHVQPMKSPTTGQPTTEIILAKVVRIHVDDTLLVKDIIHNKKMDDDDDDGYSYSFDPLRPVVDTTKLRPLGRLGGNLYTTLGEIIDIPRPTV